MKSFAHSHTLSPVENMLYIINNHMHKNILPFTAIMMSLVMLGNHCGLNVDPTDSVPQS